MVTGDNDADTNSTKESPKPEGKTITIRKPPPKMRLMNRKERRTRDALKRKAIKRKLGRIK